MVSFFNLMEIILHPEARAEIDAVDYYWEVIRNRPDIADDFADLLAITRKQMTNPVVGSRDYRAILVQGVLTTIKRSNYFYLRGNTYVLYFVTDPGAILILALTNTSQQPDYWIERVYDMLK